MTLHAEEEMDRDGLSIADVECVMLTGEVMERQRDLETAERKYRIRGRSMGGAPTEVVAKFGRTGKVVIITVYSA